MTRCRSDAHAMMPQSVLQAFKPIGALALLLMVISGCATPTKPLIEKRSMVASDWLEAQEDWSFRGKMAVSDGQEGGQLSLTWVSREGVNDIQVRSGLAGPRWQIAFGEGFARFSGTDVVAQAGQDAEDLLFEATGWPLPMDRLRHWVRGLAAPSDQQVRRDQEGALLSLEAQGWVVEFSGHRLVPVGMGQWVMLPAGLELNRPPYRIRLVTERWDWLNVDSNG